MSFPPKFQDSKTADQQKNEADDDLDHKGCYKESSDEEENNEEIDEDSKILLEEEEGVSEQKYEKARCIWHVCKLWDHYKDSLQNDISKVADLCGVHFKICEHSRNPDNCDAEDWEAMAQIISKLTLPKFHERTEDSKQS